MRGNFPWPFSVQLGRRRFGHCGPWWARVFSRAVHPKIIFKYPWKLAKTTHEPIGMDIHINETCLKTVKSAKNMGHFYRIYATGEQGVI